MSRDLQRQHGEVHDTQIICTVYLVQLVSAFKMIQSVTLINTVRVGSTTPPLSFGSIEHELDVS